MFLYSALFIIKIYLAIKCQVNCSFIFVLCSGQNTSMKYKKRPLLLNYRKRDTILVQCTSRDLSTLYKFGNDTSYNFCVRLWTKLRRTDGRTDERTDRQSGNYIMISNNIWKILHTRTSGFKDGLFFVTIFFYRNPKFVNRFRVATKYCFQISLTFH